MNPEANLHEYVSHGLWSNRPNAPWHVILLIFMAEGSFRDSMSPRLPAPNCQVQIYSAYVNLASGATTESLLSHTESWPYHIHSTQLASLYRDEIEGS